MAKYCRWNVFFSKYKEFFLLLGNFTAGLMKRFDMQRIKNVLINSSKRLDMFHSMTPELWLYEYIHDLRRERQFDKADRLEELFSSLKNGSLFFSTFSFISVWKVFTGISIIATISKLFKVQLMMWKKETTGTR